MMLKPFIVLSRALCVLTATTACAQTNVYVSPDGNDAASGTRERPFHTVQHALTVVRQSGQPAGSTVWLMDGVHRLASTAVISSELSGSTEAPFVVRAVNAGKAVLKTSTPIPASKFKLVTDTNRLDLLQEKARSHVVAADLSHTKVSDAFAQRGNAMFLVSGEWLLPLARWPNRGFGHIAKVSNKGAVWAEGRSKGEAPASSFDAPIGAEFSITESHQGHWEDEIALRLGRPTVEGFLRFDWHLERHPVAQFHQDEIKLQDHSRYGATLDEPMPRRVRLLGLLSELDQPGEWFWDFPVHTLYFWPIKPGAEVEVVGQERILELRGASNVIVRDLVLEKSREGAAILGGEHNLIAGCTIRNLSGSGTLIEGGRSNGVQACDIHDVDIPVVVNGGNLRDVNWQFSLGTNSLMSEGHFVVNNHIWNCRDRRGVRFKGTGMRFAHNLVHDLPGSALTWSGNDNVIEFNEFYSVLQEVGDWGVTYSGATWWTHGNTFRHNFVHNIYCLPQAHPVNGFYFDDLKQGDTTAGNVFYKAGYRAVMFNGGAAQTAVNNVFINCYVNAYQTGQFTSNAIAARPKYDSGELKRGDKEDYLWRTEQIVGKEGWKNPPWSTAYPKFKQAMELDPYSPVLCTIARNYHVRTIKEPVMLYEVPEDMVKPEPMMPVSMDDFVDPAALNFAFKPDFKSAEDFEPIPFAQIGLVADEFRATTPEKDAYRRAVRERNADRAPYDPDAKYDPAAINARLYPVPAYLNEPPK